MGGGGKGRGEKERRFARLTVSAKGQRLDTHTDTHTHTQERESKPEREKANNTRERERPAAKRHPFSFCHPLERSVAIVEGPQSTALCSPPFERVLFLPSFFLSRWTEAMAEETSTRAVVRAKGGGKAFNGRERRREIHTRAHTHTHQKKKDTRANKQGKKGV